MVSAEQFFVALGAVVPVFVLICIGIIIKRAGLLNDAEIARINAMLFKAFFSVMMFYNLYSTNISEALRPHLIAFCLAAVGIIYPLIFALVYFLVPGDQQRGALIHGIYRSNFVFMGVPLVANVFGEANIGVTTMLIAVIVPLYNVLGVFTLETFRGGKLHISKVLWGIAKNPMIIGAAIAAVFALIGLRLPRPLEKPLSQMAAMCGPLALIILGTSFSFSSVGEHIRYLAAAVASRLLLVPALALGAAIYFGFRGIELATVLAIFATPAAVVSFTMGMQMGSDAHLAGNIVVFSSAFSCFTVFCWLLALSAGNYL